MNAYMCGVHGITGSFGIFVAAATEADARKLIIESLIGEYHETFDAVDWVIALGRVDSAAARILGNVAMDFHSKLAPVLRREVPF